MAALLVAGGIAINVRFELWDWKRAKARDELDNPEASLRRRVIFDPLATAICAALILFLDGRELAPWSVVPIAAGSTIGSALGAWFRYRRRKAVEYDL
jgi:hypothetical protein